LNFWADFFLRGSERQAFPSTLSAREAQNAPGSSTLPSICLMHLVTLCLTSPTSESQNFSRLSSVQPLGIFFHLSPSAAIWPLLLVSIRKAVVSSAVTYSDALMPSFFSMAFKAPL